MGLDTAEHRVLARFAATVDRWPRPAARAASVVAILILALLDYASGPDLAFAVLYLIPLAVIGWTSDDNRTLPRTACVLAASSWLAADLASGAVYSHPAIPLWNTTTRLVTFLIVVTLLQSLRSAFAEQQQLARTDALTGIRNSRAFMEELTAEVRRGRRHPAPISLVYVDVDDFKAINDSHGHLNGDEVLRRVATALDTHTREVDVVGRLGGDEFAILMPSTGEAGAAKVLRSLPDRLTAVMSDLPFRVTLSTGCVTFLGAPAGVGQVLHAADELMYDAKKRGKDGTRHRVVSDTSQQASLA